MRRARLRSLLLGRDATVSRWGVALAVGLFLAVFSVAYVWLDGVVALMPTVFPVLPVLVIALSAAYAYNNEGVLVSFLLASLPTYALAIHFVHLGNTGPTPYPEAAVRAVLLGLAFGVPLGLLGGAIGIGARRLARRVA